MQQDNNLQLDSSKQIWEPPPEPVDAATVQKIRQKRAYLRVRFSHTLDVLKALMKNKPQFISRHLELPTIIYGEAIGPITAHRLDQYEIYLTKLETFPKFKKQDDLEIGCQRLIDAVQVSISNDQKLHALNMQEMFGTSFSIINGGDPNYLLPPAIPQPPQPNSPFNWFERELLLLNPRFSLTPLNPNQIHPPCTILASISDPSVPHFPPITLHVPTKYPVQGIEVILDDNLWSASELFKSSRDKYLVNAHRIAYQTIGTMLELLYNCINQVINQEKQDRN